MGNYTIQQPFNKKKKIKHKKMSDSLFLIPMDSLQNGLIQPELVFLNVYGAPESIPRNEFRQPM